MSADTSMLRRKAIDSLSAVETRRVTCARLAGECEPPRAAARRATHILSKSGPSPHQ